MTRRTLDLVIAGGGPAGISTALHVLRDAPAVAERMVVLEKERYPRDKYCAGALGHRAEQVLEALGVTIDVPKVPIDAVQLSFRGGQVVVREPGLGSVVRRLHFDHALAGEAIRRGIDVRQEAGVEGLETYAGCVRVKLAGGEVLETRVLVGADGVRGTVRRCAGLPRGRLRAQVAELYTEAVDGDPPGDTLHFDFRNPDLNGYLWDFPAPAEGHRLVCRGVYLIPGHRREDLRARLHAHLAAKGLDPGRYRLKRFAEAGYQPGEPISKPRVILVGEAAGVDICTGEGIPQAIAYGALAGRYIAQAFRRNDFRFADWLARVQVAREGTLLRRRHLSYRCFYSDARPSIERIMLRAPELLRLWAFRFAGRPYPLPSLARAIAQLIPVAARDGPEVLARLLRERMRGRARPGPRVERARRTAGVLPRADRRKAASRARLARRTPRAAMEQPADDRYS